MSYVYQCPKCGKSSCKCYEGTPGGLPWGYVCPLCREPVTGTGNVPPSHGCITEEAIRVLIREEIAKWAAVMPEKP